MSIRSTHGTRNLEARKSSLPTIGRGKPLNSQGSEGDLTFRRTSEGLMLYIKANHSWHGVKVGESFSSLESTIKDIKSKVDVMKQFRLPSTYSVTGDFTLDVSGDITLNADDGRVTIKDGTTNHFLFNCDNTAFTIYDDTDVADMFSILVGASGATNILTVDAGATVGHLSLIPDGDLILDPASTKVIMQATDGLYLDGGGDTYIYEASADNLRVVVGGTTLLDLTETTLSSVNVQNAALTIDAAKALVFDGSVSGHTYIKESSDDLLDIQVGGDSIVRISENGTDGNQFNFYDASAGFTQREPSYDATTTVADFRHTNKLNLTFDGGDIINLSMYFPGMSGNFVLLIKQDGTGSRTITNYRVYEFDESTADGENAVKWAGGSNPTLTTDANHVDILSFYWDADNEIAYGVATLDFQF